MDEHAAVRSGDEHATVALLGRLARQAARRYPPPAGYGRWTPDAVLDLVSDTFARKGPGFVAAAIAATNDDAELERYLVRVFTNVLRDQARETERGKLIDRLGTILGAEDDFAHHTSPFSAWRLVTASEVVWQGDIGELIAAARHVRGSAATRWNTSGPTPRPTRDAIVAVSHAALHEADGLVSDPDVARVVQVCVPAVPIDAADAEAPRFNDVTARVSHDPEARAPGGRTVDDYNDGSPSAEEVARAVWSSLGDLERVALVHLGQGDRAVAAALGVGRRAGASIAASARDKVRMATLPGQEDTVVFLLMRWANDDTTDGTTDETTDDIERTV